MLNATQVIFSLLVGFPILLAALISAELARGLMAEKLGDPTPRAMGRITLNPLVHIDLMGVILMILTLLAGFGIGFTKPIPVNPNYFSNYRKGIILYALAGSMMNFCLGLFGLGWLFLLFTMNAQPPALLHFALKYWVMINSVLLLFGLLPIPGFYGGMIVAQFLPYPMNQRFEELGRYGFIIFFGLLFLGAFRLIWSGAMSGLSWMSTTFLGAAFTAWAGF